jgi:hypothetical protein
MRKQASPVLVEIQTDNSILEICMQGVYNLLSFSHVNYYQTRLSRIRTSGIRGPPSTFVFSAVRRVDGEAIRWRLVAATSGRPRRPPLQPWGGVAVHRQLFTSIVRRRPSNRGRPPCLTIALNIKKCVYKCLKWKNYHFSSFFNTCHRSFQMLFGWKQFISNREPK